MFCSLRAPAILVLALLSLAWLTGCSQQRSVEELPNSADAGPAGASPSTVVEASGPKVDEPNEHPGEESSLAVGEKTPSQGQPAPKISVELGDRTVYDQLLEKHRGKVILVDFWALWCGPCVKQFPHTVEMHHKYAEKGLAVISVSVDDPDARESVHEFLTKHGAAFDNLLSRSGASDEAFTAFEIQSGAVPHYKLYDRKGKVRKQFDVDPLAGKQFTTKDIEQGIEQLLAE